MADTKTIAKAKEPGTVPASGVEVIRRLADSGTGQEKLDKAVAALEELTTRKGRAATAAEFYEYVKGDANDVPPRDAMLPPGTLAKVKSLLDTGEANPVGGVDEAAVAFAERLSALEHPDKKKESAPEPPKSVEPPKPAGPRTEKVGEQFK